MRNTVFIFRFSVLIVVLWFLGSGSLAWADSSSSAVALFPVVYESKAGESPEIAGYMSQIEESLNRSWSGQVLVNNSLSERMKGLWVLSRDPLVVSQVIQRSTRAEGVFRESTAADAIRLLEGLITESDALLPHISHSPEASLALLKAHLYLWWSLSDVGSSKERLDALMSATAQRFPAAAVDTMDMPPHVIQAFEGHREKQRRQGARSVSIYLQGADEGNCRILINGLPHGDSYRAGISLQPGRTYYVAGQCGEERLPPARMVVGEEAVEVTLDMGLAMAWTPTTAGSTLLLPTGAEQVGPISNLGVSLGDMLEVGDVILVGIYNEGKKPYAQFDRVRVGEGKRSCSVRLPLKQLKNARALDDTLRAIVANKPASTEMLFAGPDGVYLTPEEHVHRSSEGLQRPITWVSLGLSALALGTGVVLDLDIQGLQDDLNACSVNPDCRGTAKAGILRDDLKQHSNYRDVFYGLGGAFAAGALVSYFLEAPNTEDYLVHDGLLFSPWTHAAGASVVGRW